ncbi:MAG: glycosyltransferase family 2 protein [Simkaniaceae bacterium]|nr:glycosyltransferase family 2 protein [Simkaniaceae bacterium]
MISTIISYCTNDYRFLDLCIKAVAPFSSEILIPVCTHTFDGTEEDRERLHQSYGEHPNCSFLEYAYGTPYGLFPDFEKEDEAHVWHGTSRYIGAAYAKGEYLLFIDVDEIVDTERFMAYLKAVNLSLYEAIRFQMHFYFRESRYQAVSTPNYALMVKRGAVALELFLDPLERKGIFSSVRGSKLDHALGLDKEPLFHHYSWVRSQEELYKKVGMWGHRHDKDFTSLLKEEFSAPFRGRDLIYELHYKEVEPVHDPLKVSLERKHFSPPFPNVRTINQMTLKRELLSQWE